jgi:hypothetical protein
MQPQQQQPAIVRLDNGHRLQHGQEVEMHEVNDETAAIANRKKQVSTHTADSHGALQLHRRSRSLPVPSTVSW